MLNHPLYNVTCNKNNPLFCWWRRLRVEMKPRQRSPNTAPNSSPTHLSQLRSTESSPDDIDINNGQNKQTRFFTVPWIACLWQLKHKGIVTSTHKVLFTCNWLSHIQCYTIHPILNKAIFTDISLRCLQREVAGPGWQRKKQMRSRLQLNREAGRPGLQLSSSEVLTCD